jgi:WD40 repeat protein
MKRNKFTPSILIVSCLLLLQACSNYPPQPPSTIDLQRKTAPNTLNPETRHPTPNTSRTTELPQKFTPYPYPFTRTEEINQAGAYPYPPIETANTPVIATTIPPSRTPLILAQLVPITNKNAEKLQEIETLNVPYPITNLAFNPEGSILALGTFQSSLGGGQTYLENVASGEEIKTIEVSASTGVAFSNDGLNLIVGNSNNLNIYQLNNFDLDRTILAHTGANRGMNAFALSPTRSEAVSGANDGLIRIWDLANGKLLNSLKATDLVLDIAFSPDGKYFAVAEGTNVRIRDAQSGYSILELPCACDIIEAVAYSPDGHFLASGGRDNFTRIWSIDTGRMAKKIEIRGVGSIAFSPDGQLLACGLQNKTVQVWDWQSAKLITQVSSDGKEVTFNHSGTLLAFGNRIFGIRK